MKNFKIPFLQTIYNLRQNEELIIYSSKYLITHSEEREVNDFLKIEYENEKLQYPDISPDYNPSSAIWGAKILYLSAQLFLNRKEDISEIKKNIFLIKNQGLDDFLSADLCLRFLPQLYNELKNLDFEDPLLPILDKILETFHYSSIGMQREYEPKNLEELFQNRCFKLLYLNRVIQSKSAIWKDFPVIKKSLKEEAGLYFDLIDNGIR